MVRRLILLAVFMTGCSSDSLPPPSQPASDPQIRVKESVGGNAGAIGGSRTREYEGPASKAPEWTKPAQPKSK